MGCSSCGGNNYPKPTFPGLAQEAPKAIIKPKSMAGNFVEAASQQPNKFKWFRDGITGIVKCLTGNSIYSDEDIVKNRDVCRGCEHSTKQDGKMNIKSQCMAVDPATNAPCACPIVCKTQSGKCPLNKWVHITLTVKNKTHSLQNEDIIVDI